MDRIRIKFVAVGNLKCKVDFGYIEKWKSKMFSIGPRAVLGALPNMLELGYGYSDDELRELIHAEAGTDITIGIVNAQLERNFYERTLSASTAVISLFEMNEILERAEHRIEHFILRCVYTIILVFIEFDRSLSMDSALSLAHDEVRHCLFDMNMDKADIVFSLDPPTLCEQCKARLSRKQIDGQFIPTLDSEMKRIRKSSYFRASDWVKAHPVCALLITAAFGLLLNIAGNLLYDGGKQLLDGRQAGQAATPCSSPAQR